MKKAPEALELEGRSSHELAVIAETCLGILSRRAEAAGANPAPLDGIHMILTETLRKTEPAAEPAPVVYEEDAHPEWADEAATEEVK